MNAHVQISIVILTHNSEHFLPPLFESIRNQTIRPIDLICVDNASTDRTRSLLSSLGSQATVLFNDDNSLWFSRPNNNGIMKSHSEFALICNHDIILDKRFCEECLSAMNLDNRLGSISGKILKMNPHVELSATVNSAMIDSTGLKVLRSRRVIDRGENEKDERQFDRSEEIFGVSGACVFFRRKALDDTAWIRHDGRKEYFDEDFLAYKEDFDLAWRLQSRGWKSLYLPNAVAWHARGVSRKTSLSDFGTLRNRRGKPSLVNMLSTKNHWLTLLKNESSASFFKHLPWILWYECKKFLYLLFCERRTLSAVPKFFSQRKNIMRKRNFLNRNRKVSAEFIAKKWFQS